MLALLTAWLFVLGLCVGSFLNVVIARVPAGQSIVRPGSRCPKCGHPLRWYENVPLVSFLALRGRCASCKAPISWRYPLVELLTGTLFLGALQQLGWTPELALALVLVCFLVPLTFIDLDHWVLPFELTLPGIAAGVGLSALVSVERLRDGAIGAAAGYAGFWLMEALGQRLFQKEALGGGDKYLLALIGAFLTWRPLLGVIFLASLQGALVGVALILVRGRAGPAPAGAQEQIRGEVVLEKLTGRRELDWESAPLPAELAAKVKRETAEAHRVVPLGQVGPVLLVASAEQPLPEPAREALRAESGCPEVEAVRAPASEVRRGIHRLYGPAAGDAAPSPSGEEEDDDWVPGPTNLPFGPWLSLAALELLLLGDLIARAAPDSVGLLLTGRPG
ncbi:MAG TPA: prepilin peptidase [Myxococcales bacterium]|jgi:leader peptidase (prepilin peptidase)/N-methyltransferase|nr:prepilin peptidase [Myxococcales bacterium]